MIDVQKLSNNWILHYCSWLSSEYFFEFQENFSKAENSVHDWYIQCLILYQHIIWLVYSMLNISIYYMVLRNTSCSSQYSKQCLSYTSRKFMRKIQVSIVYQLLRDRHGFRHSKAKLREPLCTSEQYIARRGQWLLWGLNLDPIFNQYQLSVTLRWLVRCTNKSVEISKIRLNKGLHLKSENEIYCSMLTGSAVEKDYKLKISASTNNSGLLK